MRGVNARAVQSRYVTSSVQDKTCAPISAICVPTISPARRVPRAANSSAATATRATASSQVDRAGHTARRRSARLRASRDRAGRGDCSLVLGRCAQEFLPQHCDGEPASSVTAISSGLSTRRPCLRVRRCEQRTGDDGRALATVSSSRSCHEAPPAEGERLGERDKGHERELAPTSNALVSARSTNACASAGRPGAARRCQGLWHAARGDRRGGSCDQRRAAEERIGT